MTKMLNVNSLPYKADILIVDDKPENLMLLSKLLEAEGYKVRKAINAKLAMKGSQLLPPDLIILDINMPEINGYELCKILKNNQPTANIPIIFLSVLDEAFDKIKGLELGAIDYITKPFNPNEVVARIENHLKIYQLQQELKEKNHCLEEEINKRKKAESTIKYLLETIQLISQADDFKEALEIALSSCCKLIDWDLAEAWIPKKNHQLEYIGNYTLLKEKELDNYLKNNPHEKLVKKIYEAKKIEWWESIYEFSPPEIYLSINFKTALGVPIIVNNEIIAILLFLKQKNIETNQSHPILDLINFVCTHLTETIKLKKTETSLQKLNKKLNYLAKIDDLTQIANRYYFYQNLEKEWLTAKREKTVLSIILCDIDYFKKYNDTYGHLRGDSCLNLVAQAIKKAVKRPADLVGRYGGEEFGIILPNTDTKGALHIAKLIQLEIGNLKIAHKKSEYNYVSLSLGVVSIIPETNHTLQQLVDYADQALYQAKNRGRNQIVLYPN